MRGFFPKHGLFGQSESPGASRAGSWGRRGPLNSLQFLFEIQQDWARSETYEGCMEIMKAHTPYGIEARFVKEFLGSHGG